MQKIPENTMIVIRVFFPLLVIVTLFIIVGQFGFGKISDIRSQIKGAQDEENILSQKLDILNNIKASGGQLSNIAVTALPDSNPSLAVVSQVKILAGMNGLTLSEMKAGSPTVDGTGLSAAVVSFNAFGPRTQIGNLVNGISTIAPISIVDKIKISENTPGTTTANISVKTFWMPFPTKIPAVSQAITDLTPEEQQTLQDLNGFTQPVFNQVPAAQGGRGNPFTQ